VWQRINRKRSGGLAADEIFSGISAASASINMGVTMEGEGWLKATWLRCERRGHTHPIAEERGLRPTPERGGRGYGCGKGIDV